MLTEIVRDKETSEAAKIKSADVAEALGGLPPIKMHCSSLAVDALKAALADYRAKKAGWHNETAKDEIHR